MAPTKPLFANDRRGSSIHSDERAADEDTALLGSQGKAFTASRSKYAFWRELGLFAWAVVATAGVIVLAVLSQHQPAFHEKKPTANGKRNLIFMVSDGMGPASLSMTRSFRQLTKHLPHTDVLVLDQHFIGSSRTRSSSSLVTDSAAGATAFSCGLKSYNGAISILPDHSPCGTVLEAAKKAGYMTGLVVTTDITDATPACFAAHANLRTEEDLIAQQEVGEHPLGRVVDLMLGGGRCHFLPNTTEGSCRGDDRDITQLAQDKFGWTYIDNRKDFDALKLGSAVKLPLLGLFAPADIPYELDRRTMDDVYPSLDEMARTALKALDDATKGSDKGFFLMIEGSRIDHAGHGNDPAAQVNEILAYDKAFASVIDFLDKSSAQGVLVATSDHETGGLSVARQINPEYPHYKWLPQVLANVTHSAEFLARQLRSRIAASGTGNDLKEYINQELVRTGQGITDATDKEIEALINNPLLASYTFADMVSRRAQIGWSTHGHSAVDVNIYGTKGSEHLRGNHENTEIGEFLRNYLNLDATSITQELVEKMTTFDVSPKGQTSWMGKIPTEEDIELAMRHHDQMGIEVS